jgi:transposase-like protein
MKCPRCDSSNISKRGFRYNKTGKKQMHLCSKCLRKFVEDDGFKRMRHKKEDIVRAVSLHNDGLSLFRTKDHIWQHDGVKVTKRTISQWTKKYSNFLKSSKKVRTKIKRKTALR